MPHRLLTFITATLADPAENPEVLDALRASVLRNPLWAALAATLRSLTAVAAAGSGTDAFLSGVPLIQHLFTFWF